MLRGVVTKRCTILFDLGCTRLCCPFSPMRALPAAKPTGRDSWSMMSTFEPPQIGRSPGARHRGTFIGQPQFTSQLSVAYTPGDKGAGLRSFSGVQSSIPLNSGGGYPLVPQLRRVPPYRRGRVLMGAWAEICGRPISSVSHASTSSGFSSRGYLVFLG